MSDLQYISRKELTFMVYVLKTTGIAMKQSSLFIRNSYNHRDVIYMIAIQFLKLCKEKLADKDLGIAISFISMKIPIR